MVYSTCRVNLSHYPGPGRYSGIKWYQSRLSRFHATYGQKCAGMSTGAWSQMPPACGRARVGADARASRMRRHWTHGRGSGTVGTGRTDVVHGTVSTRRMGRGQERRSWWYLSWFDDSTGASNPKGWVIVTERARWAGPNPGLL